MSLSKVEREWKKELKEPTKGDLDYISEKDISKQEGSVVNSLAVSLLDIPGIGHAGSQYTAEQKIEAVIAYFVTGRIQDASTQCGIPAHTIRKWKQETPWWNIAVREVKRAKQEQLDSKLTNLIEKSMSELRDRLMHGDEVVTSKGEKLRRRISGRDLAMITSHLYDKRTQIREDPLSERETKKEDTLKDLKANFEKLSKEIHAKTIDGEHEIVK